MVLNCPACAAPVKFQSSTSVFAVCSYCASTLVRRDEGLESIGKMAQLPADMSPLQIGSGGKFKKMNFSVIGLKKLAWEHGLWNEWYVIFDDARVGWLAEAQGDWAMSFASASAAPALNVLTVGSNYAFGKKEYRLTDVKTARCVGSSGELPGKAEKGTEFTSADFTGEGSDFVSVDYSSSVPVAYIGEYVDFDEMKFSNLREIDGW